jgi:YaaC-like Protein
MQARLGQLLALCRSYDFVQRSYRKLHSRSLNARRTREITACFRQGNFYIISGMDADLSVRPIILYYAILSLSRGIVLLLNSEKNEESLSSSHGLESVGWHDVLYKPGDIGTLAVRTSSGTFVECMEATQNIVITRGLTALRRMYINVKKPAKSRIVSFDDLLSRIADLRDIFFDATGKHPNNFHAKLWFYENREHSCRILRPDGFKYVPYKEDILQKIKMVFRDYQLHFDVPLVIDVHGDQVFPPIVGDQVIIPFDDGSCLSNVLTGIAASYILSMLARYYPTRWVSLITNEKGDTYAPVLEALVEYLSNKFPEEMIEYLMFLLESKARP